MCAKDQPNTIVCWQLVVGYWFKRRNDDMNLFSCVKWQLWITFWLPNLKLKQIWHMAGDKNMV